MASSYGLLIPFLWTIRHLYGPRGHALSLPQAKTHFLRLTWLMVAHCRYKRVETHPSVSLPQTIRSIRC